MANQNFISQAQVKDLLDNYETIELDRAPKSYFYAIDVEQIKERSKKSDIKKIINTDELTNKEVDELASLLFMQGSDLPKLKDNEVEIARLGFNTTIGNTYGLRAEWLTDEIAYRIVTETSDFNIAVPIKISKQPLTLRQVILQFEQAEPPIGLNDLAYAIKHEDDDFDFENYIRAESAFYSGFAQFYRFASIQILKNMDS
jgi:hypothetical protein